MASAQITKRHRELNGLGIPRWFQGVRGVDMDHILERHCGVVDEDVSEFSPGVTGEQIRKWVERVLLAGVWQWDEKSGFLWRVSGEIHGQVVGATPVWGKRTKRYTSRMRVVIREDGYVITAYPVF